MSKLFSTLIILISITPLYSQRIIFSNSFVSNLYPYKIIGKVGNNFVIWSAIDKHNTSEFLIYNNDLKLLKKVRSNFIQNQTNSTLIFFNNNDSFSIAYPYKSGNVWQYRLTFFNESATELSTIIVDSSNSINAKNEDNNYYTFLQSQDKKTTCFAKFAINADSFVLKINCAFINNHTIANRQFFLPFDFLHENIDDFLIDSNSIVLLETATSDSSFSVKIIKKIFSNDYLLIASKEINSGILINGSIHLTDKPGSYLIYGAWQNKLNTVEKKYLNGFYKWTTNLNLDDKPGDTILNKSISASLNLNASCIKTENRKDFFVLQKYTRDTSSYNIYGTNYSSSAWQNELMKSVNLSSLPNISQADAVELSSLNHYSGNSLSSPNEIVRRSTVNISDAMNIFSLSNSNQLNWLKNFDSSNIELIQNPDNKTIIAGKKAIHIIYTKELKTNKTGISQVDISYSDGTYKCDDIPVWNSSYSYLLNQSTQVDDNSILIPCVKSGKVFFAKLMLE